MTLTVTDTDVRVHDLDLRIPFQFGITTLTELSHVFVRVDLSVDGTNCAGIAADHLVPKWFAKDPDSTVEQDVSALRSVIRRACDHAVEVSSASTVFEWWQDLYERQKAWADTTAHPPLVWGFGVTLLERAVIDAYCRSTDQTFSTAVRENTLGIEPGVIYEEVGGMEPAEALPEQPRDSVEVRHTVGAADPLTSAADDPDDGLPFTLAEIIDEYGLSHFKLKLEGRPTTDAERLADIAAVVESRVQHPVYTLDANEQYSTVEDLHTLWQSITKAPDLAGIRDGLTFIEQPFPRETALEDSVGDALRSWDGPPVVIDESDDHPGSLGRALEEGYAGTSHKNCKGVFKSIVNACLIEHRRRTEDGPFVFSAEDLSTVGPVSLPQDLAVVATLGIGNLERNGHHYFRGLDGFPDGVSESTLAALPSLYHRHKAGYPTLSIQDGSLDLTDVIDAPFGVPTLPDLSEFKHL